MLADEEVNSCATQAFSGDGLTIHWDVVKDILGFLIEH